MEFGEDSREENTRGGDGLGNVEKIAESLGGREVSEEEEREKKRKRGGRYRTGALERVKGMEQLSDQ